MLTNERKEKISAFLDDDLHRDELMSFSLSGEDEDAAVAQRYQLVGDTLRDELSDASFVDVSAAVREVVSDEEIYSSTQTDNSRVREDVRSEGLFGLSSWFKPVAGMAVAASVALVMVVTLSEQSVTNPHFADNADQSGEKSSIQLAVDNKAQKDAGITNIAISKQASDGKQQVNPYLVNQHLEYATQDTLQGRLPLVRAVSYEAEK